MAEVYSVKIKDTVFRYRCPSRSELRHSESFSAGNQYELQERIIVSCVLDPLVTFDENETSTRLNLSKSPYLLGDISYLYKSIIYPTGYNNIEVFNQNLAAASEYANSEEGRLDSVALASIPGLSPKELWDMEPSELYKIYATALQIAPAIGFNLDMFLNPEKYAEDIKNLAMKNKLHQLDQQALSHLASTAGFKHETKVESAGSFNVR